MTILISAAFRVAALIRREALILMWLPKSAALFLEGGAYLRPGAYWRKYGKNIRISYSLKYKLPKKIIIYEKIN